MLEETTPASYLKHVELSNQEAKVLALTTAGLSDKEVAAKLGIRLDTVRTYWDRIRHKYNGAGRSEIVAAGARHELEAVLAKIEVEVETLRASESHFKALADSMPQFVWAKRADGEYYYYNRRILEFCGQTLESALGTNLVDHIHPDDFRHGREQIVANVATDSAYEFMARIRSKDGEYRWFLHRTAPLFNTSGDLIGWVGTGTDVHDKVTFRERLAQQEQILRRAQTLGRFGAWEYDVATATAVWSDYLHEILQYGEPGQPVDYAGFLKTLNPDDARSVDTQFDHSIKTGESFDFRFSAPRLDGTIVHLRSVGDATLEAGRVTGLYGLVQDVTP